MNVRPFFGTNVLIYAFSADHARNQTSRKLLREGGVTVVQVLNEFVAITRRKLSTISRIGSSSSPAGGIH